MRVYTAEHILGRSLVMSAVSWRWFTGQIHLFPAVKSCLPNTIDMIIAA